MRGSKKWLAFIFVAMLCFCVISFNAYITNVRAEESIEHYYGGKLTARQQQYYLAMRDNYIGENALPKTLNGDIVIDLSDTNECASMEQLQQEVHNHTIDINYAYIAFIWDYPQVFWTNGVSANYSYYEYSDGTYELTTAKLSFVNSFEITQDELINYNSGIQNAVDEIAGTMTNNAIVYDYYKIIHEWVCDHITYNYDAVSYPEQHRDAYTSYPVFTQGANASVVCEGYGETYKILCDQLKRQNDVDLNCVIVTGMGVTSTGQENHLWNAVQMPDEKWYGVDATWDDQTSRIYNYFLCGQTTMGIGGTSFAKDHLAQPEVTSMVTIQYPEIATYGYGVNHDYDWEYKDGQLSITGEGALPDYLSTEGAPWYQYKDNITSIMIGSGITYIPEGLLGNYQNIESLTIPFVGANEDSRNTYDAVLGHIFGRTDVGVKQYFVREGNSARYYEYKIPNTLKYVNITEDAGIPFGAFSFCSNITKIELGKKLTTIEEMAFYSCTGLKEIHFAGNAPEIHVNAFGQCGELVAYIPEKNSSWTSENKINYGASQIDWQLQSTLLCGDVNGDEVVNEDDAIYLLYHVMNPSRYPISQDGDVDGNNMLNSDDAIYLLNHVRAPQQYPINE